MSSKSFYDFDYIIELNEKRIEGYHSAFQKVLDRFTVLIIIYSAMALFLIPLVEKIFSADSLFSWFCISFYVFAVLFLISIYFAVRLIIPVDVLYLSAPKIYYGEYRLMYEESLQQNQQYLKTLLEDLLKASYINELEKTLNNIISAFRRKNSFYIGALAFVLFSIPPYLVSLGIHLWEKKEIIQKNEIINEKNK